MSVCQFYLRGNCRYGNHCRFQHEPSNQPRAHYPNDSTFRPRHPRPPINPAFNYRAPTHTNQHYHDGRTTANTSRPQNSKYPEVYIWAGENFSNKEKALDILQQLQKEARAWLKTPHLWKFTSKRIFPGGHPLSDWADQSFEEIRWAYILLTSQNQEHNYRRAYYDYITKVDRHLVGLDKLRADTLISLKDHITECVLSNYQTSTTFPPDVEMTDLTGNATSSVVSMATSSTISTHYTPDDQLLEDERAAYASGTFVFGNIPVNPPPQSLC